MDLKGFLSKMLQYFDFWICLTVGCTGTLSEDFISNVVLLSWNALTHYMHHQHLKQFHHLSSQ